MSLKSKIAIKDKANGTKVHLKNKYITNTKTIPIKDNVFNIFETNIKNYTTLFKICKVTIYSSFFNNNLQCFFEKQGFIQVKHIT